MTWLASTDNGAGQMRSDSFSSISTYVHGRKPVCGSIPVMKRTKPGGIKVQLSIGWLLIVSLLTLFYLLNKRDFLPMVPLHDKIMTIFYGHRHLRRLLPTSLLGGEVETVLCFLHHVDII